jgi:hypothetical protein
MHSNSRGGATNGFLPGNLRRAASDAGPAIDPAAAESSEFFTAPRTAHHLLRQLLSYAP